MLSARLTPRVIGQPAPVPTAARTRHQRKNALMNARTRLTALARKISRPAALLVTLLVSACAVKIGRFVPTAANHPASPDAENSEIQDPEKSVAMSGDPSHELTDIRSEGPSDAY